MKTDTFWNLLYCDLKLLLKYSKHSRYYSNSILVGVERNAVETSSDVVDTGISGNGNPEDFGVTTPRKSSEPPVLNKRLGIYQRPMSAHGVRNQQDSTFSLAGGYNNEPGEFGSPKRTVKINAPPGGGESRAFW